MRVKQTWLIIGVCLTLALQGCIRQRPVLSAQATPQPTPTPTLPPIVQTIVAEGPNKDALGAEILSQDHFLRYLTFSGLRVYEYNGGTLFDGVCTNTYPEALSGAFELVFADKEGTAIARAPLYIRSGDSAFAPGETVVYAQIDTDMDIQMSPFSLTVTQRIAPLETASTNHPQPETKE